MKKKALLMVLAAVLIVVASIGGTLAWLADETQAITNTFTAGKVDIDLTETTGSNYTLVPGATIAKDPKVTVLANSEPSYVFVKVKNPLGQGITLNIDGVKWLPVSGISGLASDETVYKYYQVVPKATTATDLQVFTTVSVPSGLENGFTGGAIVVTAYAVQANNLTVTTDAEIFGLAA